MADPGPSPLDPVSPLETQPPFQRTPNELWLKILGQIPRGDLANINLTSRSFLPVSRTLQFEVFTFHPYDIDYSETIPRRLSQSDDEVDATIRRLEFWASDAIAPLVRQINVVPWQGRTDGSRHISTDSNRDRLVRDILVNAFFHQLCHFVHLQKLDCFLLDFTQSALQHLCQLPFLEGLVIERCSISASVAPSTPFRLARLKYVDALATNEQLEASGVQRWLTFLDPSRLECLKLFAARAAAVFLHDIDAIGIVSSLHTLDISLPVVSLQQLVSIISKTTVLKTLRLPCFGTPGLEYRKLQSIPFPSSSPVPMLAEYTGPYELLHFILPGRHLRYLNLYGFDSHGCSNAASLLESLRPFQSTIKHVESLDLLLQDVSESTFSALCSMFVSVKSLHLRMSDNDGSDLSLSIVNLSQISPSETTIKLEFIKNRLSVGLPVLRHLWLRCGRRLEMVRIQPKDGPEIIEEREGPFDFEQRLNLERIFRELSK